MIGGEVKTMKFAIDHDLHIHSFLSRCSRDPQQTNERILQYAVERGLHTICLTNHFWDETVDGIPKWYQEQGYAHISKALPLPQTEGVRFLFGCEADLRSDLTLGLAKENYDKFDLILIPTTHFHFPFNLTDEDRANKARAWVKRLDAVLNMDLPFHKVGLAHLTCGLIERDDRVKYLAILNAISDEQLIRLFTKAAKLGVGIELNFGDMKLEPNEQETILRPYGIAKQCGCKFFLGTDAHTVARLETITGRFERAIELLNLTEDDKFII